MSLLIAVIHIDKLLSLARLQWGGTSVCHSHLPSRQDISVVWRLLNNKDTSLRYSSLLDRLEQISGIVRHAGTLKQLVSYSCDAPRLATLPANSCDAKYHPIFRQICASNKQWERPNKAMELEGVCLQEETVVFFRYCIYSTILCYRHRR